MFSLYGRRFASKVPARTVVARSLSPFVGGSTAPAAGRSASSATSSLGTNTATAGGWLWAGGAAATAAAAVAIATADTKKPVSCGAARIPTGGDVIMSGTPVKEPSTGILFPQLCNGLSFVGCGVRIKYAFVKVYAVGTYVDFLSMSAVKHLPRAEIEQALLDPNYPRTIRIVMNRALAIDKYTAAIIEALEPRMKGQDLEMLEEFKKLNPAVDLVQGAEIEMTIRGDTLLYKNALGGVGTVRSAVFTKAMCDVYYGSDPVSPTHKEAVLEGITKL